MEAKVFLIDEKEYHNSHPCNFQKSIIFNLFHVLVYLQNKFERRYHT